MEKWSRLAKIGLLLLGADRFREIGNGTQRGNYAQRQELVAQELLGRVSELGEVVFPGICYKIESIQNAISVFYSNKVDFVFAAHLSWTEDAGWIRFLRDMPPVPILFSILTRDSVGIDNTFDDDSFCQLLVCNGLVGALEASGSIKRFNRPMMQTVSGTLDQVIDRARVFSAAAKARSIMRESTMGLLGPYNEVMWSTYVDPYRVFMDVGPTLHFYSVAELKQATMGVSDADADSVVRRLLDEYEMADDVDPIKLRESVRASVGFDRLCHDSGVDVMVLNDIDNVLLNTLGLRPGFIWASGENDAVVVPEGDIGSGIAVYLLKILSGSQVNYIEPFYIEHNKQRIVVAHGGPNDYRDKTGGCVIGNDVRYAKTDLAYAGAPIAWYTFPAGNMTLLHVSQSESSFKMVTSQIESLSGPHFMTSYSHGRIRPKKGDCESWVGRMADVGVTQHSGIVKGDYSRQIKVFAELMGFSFHDLDQQSA